MAEERLKAVRFQRHFHGQLKAVQAAAAVLHAAAQEVQRSALLPMILHIVLAAGNFLNTGSRNGNAVGFRLEVLPKLRLVKATSGSVSTLLHFVVASARKEQPSSPALKSELQHAGQASHLNLQLLWSEVANIRANLDDLSRTLDVVGGDGTDPFQGELSALSEDAAEQLEEASAQLQAAEMCFKELAMYLDGAAGRPDPQAFFSMLDAFADDFDRADAENAIQDAERYGFNMLTSRVIAHGEMDPDFLLLRSTEEAVARRRRSARGHLRSHSLELGALCGLEAAPAGQLRQKDNVLVKLPESAMQQTFWQQCAEAEKPVLDYGGLEEHFAAKKPKGVGGEIAQGARSTKTLLLDLQRSNNSAIFLAKLGRTPEAVCEGILRVDEELLTEENITGLLKCIPTPEEAATLGTYEGSTENLGVVERLMIHLLRIPMAEE
eukprot:gene32941-42016_t